MWIWWMLSCQNEAYVMCVTFQQVWALVEHFLFLSAEHGSDVWSGVIWFCSSVCALYISHYRPHMLLHTLLISTELELLCFLPDMVFLDCYGRIDRNSRSWVRSDCNSENLRVPAYPYLQLRSSFLEEQMLFPSTVAVVFCRLSGQWGLFIYVG